MDGFNFIFHLSLFWMEQICIWGKNNFNQKLNWNRMKLFLVWSKIVLHINHCIMFFVKSYLMGCAFDMYSQSWNDRSYGLILCFLCWFFPLSIIFASYVGILYKNRSSYETLLLRTKTFRENNNDRQSSGHIDNDARKSVLRKANSRSRMKMSKVIIHVYKIIFLVSLNSSFKWLWGYWLNFLK